MSSSEDTSIIEERDIASPEAAKKSDPHEGFTSQDQNGRITNRENRGGVDGGDAAFEIAAEIDKEGFVLTPELNKKVLRKIDFILLPLLSLTCFLSFIDKVSANYANNYGLSETLNMDTTTYSWANSIFYFAFLITQPLVSYAIQRLPLGKFIGTCTIGFGLMVLTQGFIHTSTQFMVLRFFQGFFEAGILPAAWLTVGMYWRREEQALRNGIWFNSMAGMFGGLFAYLIGHINGGLEVWRYLFLVYGPVTILIGIIDIIFLPDLPQTAWFFSPLEGMAAIARVKDNQTGIANRTLKWKQVREGMSDPATWGFFLFTFLSQIPNGLINAFSTTIIKSFGFSAFNTTLLSIPYGFISTASNIIIGYAISKTTNKRCAWIAMILLFPMVGEIVQYTHKGTAGLIGYYMTAPFNTPYVMLLAIASNNVAGYSKKLTTSAVIWIAYCTGNIAGPFFLKGYQAPEFQLAIGTMLFCFVAEIILCGLMYYYFRYLNAQKEREAEEMDPALLHSAEHAFLDLTNKENSAFRYTM